MFWNRSDVLPLPIDDGPPTDVCRAIMAPVASLSLFSNWFGLLFVYAFNSNVGTSIFIFMFLFAGLTGYLDSEPTDCLLISVGFS